jgi:hypothetical protein
MGVAMDALLEAQARAGGGDPDAAAASGMDQALHTERNRVWKLQAEAWLDEQLQGSLFTADDLQAAIGKPEPDGQGRSGAAGAWLNTQSRRRRIEFTGRMSKSSRVEGHGNMQRLWRVKDGRVEGDAGRTEPQPSADVSLSPSVGSVLDEAPAALIGPTAAGVGVSSNTGLLPPLTLEEEEEAVLLLREEGLDLGDAPPGGPPDMGEQLGLLGAVGPGPGAYTEAA